MFLDILTILLNGIPRKQCTNCRYQKASMYGHPCEPCIKSEGHINWRKNYE